MVHPVLTFAHQDYKKYKERFLVKVYGLQVLMSNISDRNFMFITPTATLSCELFTCSNVGDRYFYTVCPEITEPITVKTS
jgi:hypothetical protein